MHYNVKWCPLRLQGTTTPVEVSIWLSFLSLPPSLSSLSLSVFPSLSLSPSSNGKWMWCWQFHLPSSSANTVFCCWGEKHFPGRTIYVVHTQASRRTQKRKKENLKIKNAQLFNTDVLLNVYLLCSMSTIFRIPHNIGSVANVYGQG